jgi:protein N-terminal glutamine amidohydrolase
MPEYWPYYCEENAWKLAFADREDGAVLVISNLARQVLLLGQRAGDASGAVIWDYHVIWVRRERDAWVVCDPDCTLSDEGELPLSVYLNQTFPPLDPEYSALAPLLKVISKVKFLETFASDRSHMRSHDGDWLQPPPPWPCIGHGHELPQFIDMLDKTVGTVVDLALLPTALAALDIQVVNKPAQDV